jgi:hypothetical protein
LYHGFGCISVSAILPSGILGAFLSWVIGFNIGWVAKGSAFLVQPSENIWIFFDKDIILGIYI